MLLEIRKEFITKVDAASKLKYRQTTESFEKIKLDCIKISDFLTKYSC